MVILEEVDFSTAVEIKESSALFILRLHTVAQNDKEITTSAAFPNTKLNYFKSAESTTDFSNGNSPLLKKIKPNP